MSSNSPPPLTGNYPEDPPSNVGVLGEPEYSESVPLSLSPPQGTFGGATQGFLFGSQVAHRLITKYHINPIEGDEHAYDVEGTYRLRLFNTGNLPLVRTRVSKVRLEIPIEGEDNEPLIDGQSEFVGYLPRDERVTLEFDFSHKADINGTERQNNLYWWAAYVCEYRRLPHRTETTVNAIGHSEEYSWKNKMGIRNRECPPEL